LLLAYFCRPVREFLAKNKHVKRQDAARRELKRTMFSTLVGSSLTVVSSSFLYINILLWVLVKGPFGLVWFLNPLVFGVNMDSVLNDIGMLVLSGTAKEMVKPSKKMRSTRGRAEEAWSNRGTRGTRVSGRPNAITPSSIATGNSGRKKTGQPVTMLGETRPFGSHHLIREALKEETSDEIYDKPSSTSDASQPKGDAWVLSSPTAPVEERKASSPDPPSIKAVDFSSSEERKLKFGGGGGGGHPIFYFN
jgi:hypothetical protein